MNIQTSLALVSSVLFVASATAGTSKIPRTEKNVSCGAQNSPDKSFVIRYETTSEGSCDYKQITGFTDLLFGVQGDVVAGVSSGISIRPFMDRLKRLELFKSTRICKRLSADGMTLEFWYPLQIELPRVSMVKTVQKRSQKNVERKQELLPAPVADSCSSTLQPRRGPIRVIFFRALQICYSAIFVCRNLDELHNSAGETLGDVIALYHPELIIPKREADKALADKYLEKK